MSKSAPSGWTNPGGKVDTARVTEPATQPTRAPFFKGRAAVVVACVIGVVLLVVAGVAVYGVTSGGGGTSGPTNVSLRVESDGSTADVTYSEDGQSSQAVGVSVPWIVTAATNDASEAGRLSVVAQADGSASYITCTIVAGTKTISQNTSTGAYAVVTC